MLLLITNHCKMACSHCCQRSSRNNKHMTMKTFTEALAFIKSVNSLTLIISGGEPTDHPNFLEMMEELKKHFNSKQLLITSNGMFLENREYTKEILALGIGIQITNDPRYYPKRIKVLNHPLLTFEDNIRTIYPMGRALDNNLKSHGHTSPKCYNLRSICRKINNLSYAIRTLECEAFKFCSPMIDFLGNIKAGEFFGCTSVGTVNDTHATILENIKSLDCNICRMENNLSLFHLKAIKNI